VCMKRKVKKRYNFTIDEAVFSSFRAYCKEHCLSMSAKIEKYIEGELRGK
jgi:hypothetical protein